MRHTSSRAISTWREDREAHADRARRPPRGYERHRAARADTDDPDHRRAPGGRRIPPRRCGSQLLPNESPTVEVRIDRRGKVIWAPFQGRAIELVLQS